MHTHFRLIISRLSKFKGIKWVRPIDFIDITIVRDSIQFSSFGLMHLFHIQRVRPDFISLDIKEAFLIPIPIYH